MMIPIGLPPPTLWSVMRMSPGSGLSRSQMKFLTEQARPCRETRLAPVRSCKPELADRAHRPDVARLARDSIGPLFQHRTPPLCGVSPGAEVHPSRRILAHFRSKVSNPSVKRSYTARSSWCASRGRPCDRSSRVSDSAARNSHDRAP